MGTILIPLNSPKYPGACAVIDEQDLELVSGYRWYVQKNRKSYYAQGYKTGKGMSKKIVMMHRLILQPPKGFLTDHIDGDGLNNTRANLRMATPSENAKNRIATGRSPYLGVSIALRKGRQYWRAQIFAEGRNRSLGYFDDEVEAARAYDKAARVFHGEFARLNGV